MTAPLTGQLGSVAFGFSILVLASGVWSFFSVSRGMQQHMGLPGRDLVFEVSPLVKRPPDTGRACWS